MNLQQQQQQQQQQQNQSNDSVSMYFCAMFGLWIYFFIPILMGPFIFLCTIWWNQKYFHFFIMGMLIFMVTISFVESNFEDIITSMLSSLKPRIDIENAQCYLYKTDIFFNDIIIPIIQIMVNITHWFSLPLRLAHVGLKYVIEWCVDAIII